MTISNWLMILAVFLGPLTAVQVQKFIESRREKKNRRLYIFRALMATRGNPISGVHVEALNMIDIEFYGDNNDDQKVTEAWRSYLNHLCNYPRDRAAINYQAEFSLWSSKNTDLLIDLLYEMSKCLKYSFDKVTLRRDIYVPQGHQDFETEQNFIRQSLVEVFLNRKAIPIDIRNLNPPSQPASSNRSERSLPHGQ